MGVKIQDLIRRTNIELSLLSGKIIAIDAPNIIMGLLNYSRKNSADSNNGYMVDRTQRIFSHLYGLIYRINFYYSKKVFPIFCFDGRDSELKRIITKDQLSDFRFTVKRYNQAIESNNRRLALEIALSKEFFWKNILSESKKLLSALGVPYIESPSSAESQCAKLVKSEIANFSNSQDYDSLLFGCPQVVMNLSKSLRRKQHGKWIYKKIQPVVIDLDRNLKLLNLNQFQLVDMGILIGNDYFSGIKGIGQKTALHLIHKYQNLEKIIRNNNEAYDFSNLTIELINKIRKIFLIPEVIEVFDSFYWNPPDITEIKALLCLNHTLNEGRVIKIADELKKNYFKCKKCYIEGGKIKSHAQKSLEMFL